MRSGQFYRGKIGGVQKHYESPNLEQLLPSEKLAELASYDEVGFYPRFFRAENTIAQIQVEPAENTDGRRGGITVHVVLYRFDAGLTHESVPYVFDTEKFIKELQHGARRFKMPEVPDLPEDSGYIDCPPQIEWEVQQ